jgi:CubicO group peptidase (beta-lactamase class C family)
MRKRSTGLLVLGVLAMASSAGAATVQWGQQGDVPVPRDFDGDGLADFVIWRPGTGTWWILGSVSGGVRSQQWGQQGDVPVPGDYDGDGHIDFAIWRPSTGTWWVLNSVTNASFGIQWGQAGDIPVPGDYDADGRTEFAVFRPSTGQWFTRNLTGQTRAISFGAAGDVPLPGDYDGIPGDDFAVWTPWNASWRAISGGSLQSVSNLTLGDINSTPTTARFCAATVAHSMFRFGLWSTPNQPFAVVGQAGDIPVPANFSGDWVEEYAVFRPSTGTWITQASSCDHWFASRDRMVRATQRVRGLAVVAVKNSGIVFAEGAGMANQTTPASADIPWQIASISKLFIGTALMTAVDDGLVTLDSPSGVWDPVYSVPTTVRQHVTHTSGLGQGCYSIGNFHASSNLAQELSCLPNAWTGSFPGTHESYSNVGAAWTARMLEQLTGIDFNTYTRDNIFTPLHMNHTGWFLSDFAGQQTAIGYANGVPTNDLGVTPYPMGNLRASARDLGTFMLMWINGGVLPGGARILAPNTTANALELLLPGISAFGVHWGRSVGPDGRVWWGHGGVMPGNCTRLNIDPIAKSGVVILTNGPCPAANSDIDLIETTVRARLAEL